MKKQSMNKNKIRKIKKVTYKMRAKLMFVFFVLLSALIVLVGRLIYITNTDGERYEKKVLAQQTYTSQVIPYKRGSILDRNKTVLAVSEKVYNVILDVKVILEDEKYLNPTSKAITASFPEVTLEKIQEIIEKKPDSRYSKLIKGISYDEMMSFKERQEKDENIKGVWFEEDYVRKYPYKTLASDVIGFTTSGNVGNWGVEQYYNDILNGTNGIEFGYMDKELNLESTVNPAINGNTIVTTIDANIQGIIQEHIKEFNKEIGSENIGVLIMNPNNGEILAMASNEEYDLNNPKDLSGLYTEEELSAMSEEDKLDILNHIWRNFVISDTFEPGSTFKPFTIAAALDEDIVHTDDTFVCDGHEIVTGVRINCSNRAGHGLLTLTESLMFSCNDALMQIGAKEGKSLFYHYQTFYGFGSKTGIDLPGEEKGIIMAEKDIKPVDLASSSFGQTFKTTMIQLASGFSSLVNGGYYYKPHVVKQILDDQGTVVSNIDKELVKVSVSKETSDFIKNAMYETVEEGTAKYAQVAGYKVGGKTGTAQKFPREAKTYVVSFIGAVPADNPEIVIYVVIDEPQNVEKQADSSIATKFASKILADILPFLEIYPDSDTSTNNEADTVSLPTTSETGNTTENATKEEGDNLENSTNNEKTENEGNKPEDNESAENEEDKESKTEESSEFNPEFLPSTTDESDTESGN